MKMRWKEMKKVPLICFKTCELKTKLGALCIFLRNDCDIMMSAHDYSHESNAVVFLKFNKPNFLMKKKWSNNIFFIKFLKNNFSFFNLILFFKIPLISPNIPREIRLIKDFFQGGISW
jgi:hypothetical protein